MQSHFCYSEEVAGMDEKLNKALDIAKAYSLEHNTRCVVAMAVFGYDRYMDFYI